MIACRSVLSLRFFDQRRRRDLFLAASCGRTAGSQIAAFQTGSFPLAFARPKPHNIDRDVTTIDHLLLFTAQSLDLARLSRAAA